MNKSQFTTIVGLLMIILLVVGYFGFSSHNDCTKYSYESSSQKKMFAPGSIIVFVKNSTNGARIAIDSVNITTYDSTNTLIDSSVRMVYDTTHAYRYNFGANVRKYKITADATTTNQTKYHQEQWGFIVNGADEGYHTFLIPPIP